MPRLKKIASLGSNGVNAQGAASRPAVTRSVQLQLCVCNGSFAQHSLSHWCICANNMSFATLYSYAHAASNVVFPVSNSCSSNIVSCVLSLLWWGRCFISSTLSANKHVNKPPRTANKLISTPGRVHSTRGPPASMGILYIILGSRRWGGAD